LHNFITQDGTRRMRLEPRDAARVGLLATSLMEARLRAARVAQFAQPAHRAVTDRRVRREIRRAKIYAFCASRRARRIGVARTITDKRVSRNLSKSVSHAARAATFAIRPRPRHRVRNTALAVVGTSAAAATAYGAWRRYAASASGAPNAPPATDTAETRGQGGARETQPTPQQRDAEPTSQQVAGELGRSRVS
jgi:hypothetical protein